MNFTKNSGSGDVQRGDRHFVLVEESLGLGCCRERAEISGWKSQETPRFFLVSALSPDELVKAGGDLAPGARLGESRI